jgi:hypothetical protein
MRSHTRLVGEKAGKEEDVGDDELGQKQAKPEKIRLGILNRARLPNAHGNVEFSALHRGHQGERDKQMFTVVAKARSQPRRGTPPRA